MSKVLKSIGAFAGVAFLLLGILFGMQIMTFIFAQIGPNSASTIADISASVTNESSAYINETGYTLAKSTVKGFSNPSITNIFNATDGLEILVGNYTLTGNVITNATPTNWDPVNVTYTYNLYSDQRNAIDNVNNDSLQSIIKYTGQSGTQMTTVAIAITLAILIALFLLFWTFFIKGKRKDSKVSGGKG